MFRRKQWTSLDDLPEEAPVPMPRAQRREATALELAVHARLETCVSSLVLRDIAEMLPGRPKPRRFRHYELVPLRGTTEDERSYYGGPLRGFPDGVRSAYVDHGGRPWVDANYGIGLVYRGTLAAVGMACATLDTDKLRVLQLQCVDQTPREPSHRTQNGLYGGFYWRDTLVRAWEEVGAAVGSSVEIQGVYANPHCNPHDPAEIARFYASYDIPAQRLDYTPNHNTHIWSQPVATVDSTEAPAFKNPYWGFEAEW